MDINDLTIGQAKELASMFGSKDTKSSGLNSMVGKKVIVRTYSAGVWFGTVSEKCDNEVILTDARRMYQWWAKESISLSAVAIYGLKKDKSKIIEAVPSVWLQPIEIIPCSNLAIQDLESVENVKAS